MPTAIPKSTCAAATTNASAIRSAATANSLLLSFILSSAISRCTRLSNCKLTQNNEKYPCSCRTFEVTRRRIDDLLHPDSL